MPRPFNTGAVTASRLASDDERWYDRAACYGRPVLFDNVNPQSVDLVRFIGETYCAECPVQRQCLNDALEYGAVSTVRAGVLFDYHGQPRNVIRHDSRYQEAKGKLIFVARR